jgi:hypothetical protein
VNAADQDATWLIAVVPVVILAMWVGMSNLIAIVGGWRRLAASYLSTGGESGPTFRFRSAKLGLVDYSNCLILTASRSGLIISMLLPFRLAHPTLFIPWREISATSTSGWVKNYVEFRFAKEPQVRMRLPHRLAEELIAAGGNAVALSPSAAMTKAN